MSDRTDQIGLPIAPESEAMPWTSVKVLLGKKKGAGPGKQEVKRDNLEGADPELCIQYFQRGLNYRGLKNRLKTADQEWIEDFLERDGLTAIFDALTGLGKRGISSVTDALDQLHCVAAVKEVMNRPAGLEYVIEEGSGRSLINTLVLGEFCSVLTSTRAHSWFGGKGKDLARAVLAGDNDRHKVGGICSYYSDEASERKLFLLQKMDTCNRRGRR